MASVVQMLLRLNPIIDERNSSDMTPLMWMIEKRKNIESSEVLLHCFRLLIENGSDLTTVNKNGDGIFHLLAEQGLLDLMQTLVNEYPKKVEMINVNLQNAQGKKKIPLNFSN